MFGSSKDVNIVINAEDRASKTFEKFGSVGKKSLLALGVGVGAVTTALTAFGISSFKAYATSSEQLTKLRTIIKNHTGETDKNVDALNAQAKALERVGVFSADVTTAAQAQFATFDLSSASIEKLVPHFLDMLVAEKGMAATTMDAKDAAQSLGNAFMGNFESLRKQGFAISEAQANMIKFGDESQKVQAIQEILGTTYDGLNAKLAETPIGKVQQLSNTFDNLKQSVGEAIAVKLLPLLDATKVQFDLLQQNWAQYVQPKLDRLNSSFSALSTNLAIAGGQASGTQGKVSGLTGAVITLIQFVDGLVRITNAVTRAWNGAVEGLSNFFAWIMITRKGVEDFFAPLDRLKSKIEGVLGKAGKISSVLGNALTGNVVGLLGNARGQFAGGGVVPGRPGEAVPIIAHGGEMITNPALGQTTNNDYKINVSLNSSSAVSMFFRELDAREVGRRFGVA